MTKVPIDILHLEDSDLDATIVRHRLDKSGLAYTLERVTGREGFLARLAEKKFDLILSDYQVPGFDGLAALAHARLVQPDTPFIFVSGAMGEDLATETLKHGATDYVIKDRLTRLPAAIERALVEAAERSRRRKIEEDLLSSFERFRQLADSLPQMVWVTRADGFTEYFNRRWYEFTGAPEHATDGDAWMYVLHPEDQERAIKYWHECVKSGQPYEIEYRMRHASGVYRWALARGLPIRNSEGVIERWFGTCTDIHDQKLTADELRMHRERLQQLVDERTAALEASHRQLRLSERMAALGTLSAGLGHDMGNLLMPIRIRLEALLRAELPDNLRQDVEAISTAAEYLRRLSTGLRQLAIDPMQARALEATDIKLWMEETQPIMRNALPPGIALEYSEPEGVCVAPISKAGLTQAVFNLVQNAGDAMRERGSGKVAVSAQVTGNHVMILVRDNGPGMTPEVKARCMEPYFTTKTRGISTGMGLSFVYRLLQEAGGSVSIQSEVSAGTTFQIMLPSIAPKSTIAAGARTAVVEVADARLRAVIATQLKSLGFSIGPRTQEMPSVFVLDDAGAVARGDNETPVILLADVAPTSNGHHVTTIGQHPPANTLLQALRSVASSFAK
jgi:PAS domain S-box-containing protein